jgi:hypothetical protein
MTTSHRPSACRDIIFALLRAHGPLTQQDIVQAVPLEKEEARRAITAMRRTAVITRIAPLNDGPGVSGRYALTGKPLSRNTPNNSFVAHGEVSFDGLLAAWRIAVPKTSKAYPSRVIRMDSWGVDLDLVPSKRAASQSRAANA